MRECSNKLENLDLIPIKQLFFYDITAKIMSVALPGFIDC